MRNRKKIIEELTRRLGTFGFVIVSGVSSLVVLTLMPIVTAVLGVDRYAEFSIIMLHVQSAINLSLFGVTTQFTVRGSSQEGILRGDEIVFRNWLFFYAVLTVALLPIMSSNFGLVAGLISVFVIFIRAVHLITTQFSRVEKNLGLFTILQLISYLAFWLSVITISMYFPIEGREVFLSSSVVFMLSFIFLVKYFRNFKFSASAFIPSVPDLSKAKFGIGAMLHSLVGVFIVQWDKFYVGSHYTNDDVASYMLAVQYHLGFTFVLSTVCQAYTPNLYAAISEDSRFGGKNYFHTVRKIIFLYIGASFLYVIFLQFVFPYLLSGAFEQAAEIGKVLALAGFLQGLYFITSNYILYYEKSISLAAVGATVSTLIIILLFIMSPDSLAELATLSIFSWAIQLVAVFLLAVRVKNETSKSG